MFDLEPYLENRKSVVEEALFQCLPSADLCPAQLSEAIGHAVKSGGKRLRPILCLAAAEVAEGASSTAIFPACAVELLHTYTLVHDDLPCMDNDLLRRGQPTVHAKYGEALAVLAGDALLTLAFETVARTPVVNCSTTAELVGELSRASGAGGVIGGQVEDINFAGNASVEIINYVFQHKTADLFRAAARMGAISVNAPHRIIEQLSTYAGHLGFAFQIIDDILDAAQAKSSDEPELSCLDIMSIRDARTWAREHTLQATEALKNLPGNSDALRSMAEMMLKRII